MDNIQAMLYGALIGFFVRELLIFSIELFCEESIKWRCRKLPDPERLEIVESMIADLKTQRSTIGMLKMAFTQSLDDTQPPKTKKEGNKDD